MHKPGGIAGGPRRMTTTLVIPGPTEPVQHKEYDRDSSLQQLSVHEAGHATVAAHLGCPVASVEMWATRTSDSLTVKMDLGGLVHCGAPMPFADAAAMYMAGHAANHLADERLQFGDFASIGNVDLVRAEHAIRELCPAASAKRQRRLLRREWERARDILEAPRASREVFRPGFTRFANTLCRVHLEAVKIARTTPVGRRVSCFLEGKSLADALTFANGGHD